MVITITKKNIAIFISFIFIFAFIISFITHTYSVSKFHKDMNLVVIQPQDNIIKNALISITEQNSKSNIHKDTIALIDYTNIKTVDYIVKNFHLSSSQKDELMEMNLKKIMMVLSKLC